MHDDPLIHKTMLQEFDPELFTACGRALYLAQHFERNFKGIVAALDLRTVSPSDEETLNTVCEKNFKRPLGSSLSNALPKHVPDILKGDFDTHMLPQLDSAREARNRIAHEFLCGIEGLDICSTEFDEFIELFRRDVQLLADADYSVCCMIQGFNREPAPTCRNLYIKDIVKWVFEPIDGLLQDGQQEK